MSAFDRIHRLNRGLTGTLTLVAVVIYNACAVLAGVGAIFFAWWLPDHYGWQFNGWWRLLPLGLTAFAAIGVWQGVSAIIAATRSPPAPPPTTPGTW